VGTGFSSRTDRAHAVSVFQFSVFQLFRDCSGMSRAEIRQKFDEMVALVSGCASAQANSPTDWGLAEFSGVVYICPMQIFD